MIIGCGRAVSLAFAVVLFILPGQVKSDGHDTAPAYMVEVQRAYDDVRFDLENAIIDRGLVIDFVSHVGDMLSRTRADVGSDKEIFVKAESMLFCSARLSRAAMEADPRNLASCPYAVFLYEEADRPGTVTVGYRRLEEVGSDASKKALADINALLMEIVGEAISE